MDEKSTEMERAARELCERRGAVTPAELADHLQIPEPAAASLLEIVKIDVQLERHRSRFPRDEGPRP